MAAPKKLKIGVIVNRSKAGALDVINQLIEFAVAHPNLQLLFERRTGALVRRGGFSETELAKRSDLLLVAGGDGSLLDVVGAVYPTKVPILGVNIGSLGFLTAAAETEVDKILPCLAEGDLLLSKRMALETTFHRLGGRSHVIPCALNDVVISRVNVSSLIRVRVEVGDFLITEYVCDGLIIATPTGSTAYSLASGGPIMSPDAEGIVINPICPHALTNRPVIVGIDDPIRIHLVPKRGVAAPAVQFDGRPGGSMRPHEWLEIRPAKHPVNLAYLPHSDFFRVLRQKLKWSGASV
jgi:NAD+ kinase